MANLGICRKCPDCWVFSPAVVDSSDVKLKMTFVNCELEVGPIGWTEDVPAGCPYVLEHKLTEDAMADLDDKEDEDDS